MPEAHDKTELTLKYTPTTPGRKINKVPGYHKIEQIKLIRKEPIQLGDSLPEAWDNAYLEKSS